MTYFKNKTVIMSGGSRGVGLEIAKALGKDGANIAILAKTTEPHPTLPGTIFTAAEEIEQVRGNALPIVCDIRYEEQVVLLWKKLQVSSVVLIFVSIMQVLYTLLILSIPQ